MTRLCRVVERPMYPSRRDAQAVDLPARRRDFISLWMALIVVLWSFGDGNAQIIASAAGRGGESVSKSDTKSTAESVHDAVPSDQQALAVTPQESEEPEKDKKTEGWKLKLPKVSGYIQMFYRDAFDTSDDGVVDASNFRIQRARIAFKGDITPRVSYDIEVDPRSPEIKGVLRDAFIRFRFIPHHQVRLGQQKTQFGYENPESSSRLYVVNRAEVSDNLSRGLNLRDIGVGLIGNVPLGSRFRFEDAITVVNGAGLNAQDDNTKAKNTFGRLGLRYKSGDFVARLGVSSARGDQQEFGDSPEAIDDYVFKFDRTGADFEIDHRLFFLNAEYVTGDDDIPDLTFPDPTPAETVERKGSYVLVGLKTRWKIGPVVRYDTLDDDFKRWTIGGYYGALSDTLRVLVNFERRELRDGSRADDKLYFWLQVRF